MSLVASLVVVLLGQQLSIEPYPGRVGEPMTVTLRGAEGPVAGCPIEVEVPSGVARPLGATSAAGAIGFVPEAIGQHVFTASVGGLRVLAPCPVVGAGRRRWLAVGSVPLGLALLWRLSRARGRRAP
ncbi:MAG: hypothetical protein KF830_02660 [Planctomycetes bacterium]|nr:hypothetical protein [Planctomycetota bacterium]